MHTLNQNSDYKTGIPISSMSLTIPGLNANLLRSCYALHTYFPGFSKPPFPRQKHILLYSNLCHCPPASIFLPSPFTNNPNPNSPKQKKHAHTGKSNCLSYSPRRRIIRTAGPRVKRRQEHIKPHTKTITHV